MDGSEQSKNATVNQIPKGGEGEPLGNNYNTDKTNRYQEPSSQIISKAKLARENRTRKDKRQRKNK